MPLFENERGKEAPNYHNIVKPTPYERLLSVRFHSPLRSHPVGCRLLGQRSIVSRYIINIEIQVALVVDQFHNCQRFMLIISRI